jgi:DNA-directed RNA polymerase subunit RPC12/RpoP
MNHQSAESRKEYGLRLEREFEEQGFGCHKCGGRLVRNRRNYWKSDFICENCGQQVEVKGSPKTEDTGNIAISADAWKNYDEDVLIVTNVTGTWMGRTKWKIERDCDCIHEAIPSTHSGSGGYNGGSYSPSFHLIPVSSMRVIG